MAQLSDFQLSYTAMGT